MSTDHPDALDSPPLPSSAESERYPHLGTKGVSVSSSASADVAIQPSRTEGWMVATALLLAGCISMGIYLVVLHH
ncbi:MAG TPA: hypothetical protein VI138_05850 [Candidatus Dormibacteraeota bacterium]